jgi:hypothetical protein
MSGRPLCMGMKVGREYFKGLMNFINNEYFEADKYVMMAIMALEVYPCDLNTEYGLVCIQGCEPGRAYMAST